MVRSLMAATLVLAILGLVGLAQTALADDGKCCAPDCMKKVCVATTEIKKVDKRCFSSTCEDFCVPHCSMHGHGHKHGCDKDCGPQCPTCPKCEHKVRTKKYLVVKVKKEDQCVTKCLVSHEPKCQRQCQQPWDHGMIIVDPTKKPEIIQPPK